MENQSNRETIKVAIREGFNSKREKFTNLQVWLNKNQVQVTEREKAPAFAPFAVKALRAVSILNKKNLPSNEYSRELAVLADKIKHGEI